MLPGGAGKRGRLTAKATIELEASSNSELTQSKCPKGV